MKVRIEFEQKDGEDPESFYDVVEFTTTHAGCISEWANAVHDFLRPCGYHKGVILLAALLDAEIPEFLGIWGRENREQFIELRDQITEMIENPGPFPKSS